MFTGLNTPDIHYIAKYNKSVNWNFERFFLLRESLRPFGRLRDLAVVLLRQRRVKRTNSFVHFRAEKQAAVGCHLSCESNAFQGNDNISKGS